MKAQVSIEFFVFIGIAFFISIAFCIYALDRINDVRIQNEGDASKDLSLKIQREILIASYVEDGYKRHFEIPDKIGAVDYSLLTQNSTVTLQSPHSLFIVSIPIAIGNITKGRNEINKTEGVIYIN